MQVPRLIGARRRARAKGYKGRCNHHNCWSVCMTEGNTGGFCKGRVKLGRTCVCNRDCGGGGGAPKVPPGGGSDPPVLAGVTTRAPNLLLGRRGDHAR